MKALTIHMTPRADGQPGADVVLKEGGPAEGGATLAGPESLPPLAPALDADLKALRQAMLDQTGKIAKLAERAEAIGKLLLPGAIGTAWKARLDAASAEIAQWVLDRNDILRDPDAADERKAWARARPGYRTYLLIEAADRDWIPWEFARLGGEALFLLDDAPFSRYQVMPGDRRKARPGWQIRVLILVAAENPEEIGAYEEVRAIKDVLRRLDRIYDVDVIKRPTREELASRLRDFRPHVLHFIGHGAGDHLQINNGTANHPWGVGEIAEDIGSGSWIPEVVYLNACRSQGVTNPEKATAADQDRQRTIVEALFGRQVLAVVAMQADVRGGPAGAAAAAFYGAMLDGSSIDAACAKGRVTINRIPGREGTRDPYLPVITLTVPADQVLRHTAVVTDPAAPMVHERLELFVDRYEERRKIVRAIDDQKHVIVLRGAQDIGKTSLLCWSIDMCLRREHHVRYLELGACADWLEVLRALRKGGSRVHIEDPLGDLLGPSFNWKLSNLAKGIVKPAGAPSEHEQDTAGTLSQINASPDKPPDFGRLVCNAFHDALTVNRKKPLVLVFDQMEAGDRGLGSDQFSLLREQWIDPLIARGDGRVCLLLAIRSERQYDYKLDTLPPYYGGADVSYFAEVESLDLLRELFRLKLSKDARASAVPEPLMLQEMEEVLSGWSEEAVTGKKLDELLGLLWGNCVQRVKRQQKQGRA